MFQLAIHLTTHVPYLSNVCSTENVVFSGSVYLYLQWGLGSRAQFYIFTNNTSFSARLSLLLFIVYRLESNDLKANTDFLRSNLRRMRIFVFCSQSVM